jgi:uncharacterized membrane protein
MPQRRRGWWPWRALRTRPSLAIAAIVMVLAGGLSGLYGVPPATAFLGGFDLGVLVFLGLLLRLFADASPERMRQRAREQVAGRWSILWGGVALSAVVLLALGTELQADRNGGWLAIMVAIGSIVLSWLFLNTTFALHYAHGYYGDLGSQHEGLEFPGTRQPDYWDFAYFAIVVGMTFQVSDVQVTSPYLRRMVLLHSVIAFFFNVFILAVSVNVVAGKVT